MATIVHDRASVITSGMKNIREVQRVRQAVLKAMYDLTREKRKPNEIPMPTRNELAERVGIGIDETAYALEYLTAKHLATVEELGDDDSPNYRITPLGSDVVESMPEVMEVSPQDEHQPLIMDLELIRALLIYIANNAREHQYIPQPDVAEYSSELVSYHLSMMREAGLIKGQKMLSGKWGIGPLTFEGQQFLAAAKDDKAWRKFLGKFGDMVGTVALGTVKDLLLAWARGAIG
jgi:DNA-binding transcriptional ArsR family regulator